MFGALLGLVLWLTVIVASAQTGTIQGTVKLPPRELPEPKPTPQYPGQSSGTAAFPTSPMPAVVFVKGKLQGQPHATPAKHPMLGQKDAWFIPEVMAVLVGTTVDFPNLDTQYHNVFSYSKPKRFDLGRYPTGESRAVTFDQPGVVKIYCEIHEHMRATVVVCENPFFAVTDTNGTFRIENVPVGRHSLAAWRIRGKDLEKDIDVVAGETLQVSFE